MDNQIRTKKTIIFDVLAKYPDGANIEDISFNAPQVPRRSLQRWLAKLAADDQIEVTGKARATLYKLKLAAEATNKPGAAANAVTESIIPLSEAGRRIRDWVTAPILHRKPVGYRRKFLEDYRPNVDSYLTEEEIAKLTAISNGKAELPAGTYAQQILNRLLIDLSWNSSRLEGNTYSLLDTERLIQQGEVDDTKSAKEAQMILNHKDAIEFIVQSAETIGYNRYTITNLHAMLANNLLADPQAPGRLRSIAVGISGSVYTPLAIPQLVSDLFEVILEKTAQIENPFEQSFFLMVHLPYLQPFDDVNKRVSRISANIPFIKHNLSPLSFIDLPDDLYTQGILGIYEFNEISMLKDVFLWAYERSATQYAVIRQSLGEPDMFKLQYRTQIRELINMIIRDAMDGKNAGKLIRFKATAIPKSDQSAFIMAVETEIRALHEGNFARYGVSQSEYEDWRRVW